MNVDHPRSDRLVRAGGALMLASGLICLGFWMQGRLEAESTRIQARTLLRERWRGGEETASTRPALSSAETPMAFVPIPEPVPRTGDVVGRVEIPGRKVSAPVVMGDSADVLRRAVGLVPGTALPGRDGNCALAGHRDSFFRGLGSVKKGDRIEIETPTGDLEYRVEWTRVVEPDDVWVLDPVKGERSLTLITCFPFHWIGHAPHRFVVRAVEE